MVSARPTDCVQCMALASGLVYQMYLILTQYFSCPTVITVMFDLPQVLHLPSLYFVINFKPAFYQQFSFSHFKQPLNVDISITSHVNSHMRMSEMKLSCRNSKIDISKHVSFGNVWYRSDSKSACVTLKRQRTYLSHLAVTMTDHLRLFANSFYVAIATDAQNSKG